MSNPSDNASSAPAPATAASGQNQAPATPQTQQQQGSLLPQGAGLSPADKQVADETLKQMDNLKEQLRELEKEKEKNKQLEALTARLMEKEKASAEQYKKEREPQAKEYIEAQEKNLGMTLSEALKKQYYNAFTNPEFKQNADLLWKQHQHAVELAASAKAKDEELTVVRTEKTKLSETLSKVGQQVGGMRASYAQSLTPAQTEAAMRDDEASNRKAVGVNASAAGLGLGEIMCATPAAWEMQLPFLVQNNFAPGEVNASGSYDQNQVIRRTSVQAAREHRLLRDEQGEIQFPASMRYLAPHLYGFMCNDSGLAHADSSDLGNYVQFNAERTFVKEKRVDDFKHTSTA